MSVSEAVNILQETGQPGNRTDLVEYVTSCIDHDAPFAAGVDPSALAQWEDCIIT
jgi:hypothetical protein